MTNKLSPEVMKRMSVLKINRERDLYKKIQDLLKKKREKEVFKFITEFSPRWRSLGSFVNEWVDYILQETVYGNFFWLAENVMKFKGIDPNVQDSPLQVAAMYNRMNWIKLLLKHPKIDLNTQDYVGKTALHWALLKGLKDVVQILIEHGADERVKDKNGNDCLDVSLDTEMRNFAVTAIEERTKKREELRKREEAREKARRLKLKNKK